MLSVSPNIVGLIFVKRIEVDVQRAEYSVHGLFHDRAFSSSPTPPVEMFVIAQLTGGRGEGILQLAAYSLNDMEAHDTPSDWKYRQQKWVKFAVDPNRVLTLEFRITKLIFPKPGAYLFAMTFDGALVAERRMLVIEKEP